MEVFNVEDGSGAWIPVGRRRKIFIMVMMTLYGSLTLLNSEHNHKSLSNYILNNTLANDQSFRFFWSETNCNNRNNRI